MRPAAPRRVLLAAAAVIVLLAAPHEASAQPASPPARVDDSTVNGIVAGGALGAIGGFLAANVADARCGHELCNNPTVQTYALGVGVGTGAGIGVGWLIDKLHKGKAPVTVSLRTDPQERSVRVTLPLGTPRLRLASMGSPARMAQAAPARPSPEPVLVDDPLTNGALIGAAVGGGIGFLAVGTAYAICADSNCGPPSEGPTWAIGTAAGAGIGLVTGLLIDKARRDPSPPIAVAVRADRQEKAVRVQWRF